MSEEEVLWCAGKSLSRQFALPPRSTNPLARRSEARTLPAADRSSWGQRTSTPGVHSNPPSRAGSPGVRRVIPSSARHGNRTVSPQADLQENTTTSSHRPISSHPDNRTITGNLDNRPVSSPHSNRTITGPPNNRPVSAPDPAGDRRDSYGHLDRVIAAAGRGDLSEDEGDDDAPQGGRSGYFGERVYQRCCRQCRVRPLHQVLQSLRGPTICVRYRALRAADVKPLAITLVSNPYVTRLDLRGNCLGAAGTAYVADLLRENIFITELDLSENDIQTSGVDALCESLASNTTVHTLRLSGNALDSSSARLLASLLKTNTTLKELDLSHNQLGVKSGHLLGNALVTNHTLRTLDLSWNQLRLDGARSVCASLQKNCGLRTVSLRFNGLSLEGCQGLEVSLSENTCLRDLDVSCNRISGAGVACLLRGLGENGTLTTLRVGDNPIPPGDTLKFLEMVQKNEDCALRELDLTHVSVDARFADAYAALSRPLVVRHDVLYRSPRLPGLSAEPCTAADPLLLLLSYIKDRGLRLIDVFHSFDEDKSMSVSRGEFVKGLESAGITVPNGVMDALMARLDLDGDGEINFRELVRGNNRTRRRLMKAKLGAFDRRRESLCLVSDTDLGHLSGGLSTTSPAPPKAGSRDLARKASSIVPPLPAIQTA